MEQSDVQKEIFVDLLQLQEELRIEGDEESCVAQSCFEKGNIQMAVAALSRSSALLYAAERLSGCLPVKKSDS